MGSSPVSSPKGRLQGERLEQREEAEVGEVEEDTEDMISNKK